MSKRSNHGGEITESLHWWKKAFQAAVNGLMRAARISSRR
ncbi:hypothetical protein CLOSTHATH_04806 [Hungatella hathewayi DSM 13479]|uniref:Uncharacterized protein n=1 Tax=Hungatella hathewayi DSM 13479 TaxID=566550 RepID=D3AMF6_9FIRM|nr:hypothetical protein CLOSTHATH_04806 [Hungatella hathewayi DSM 13479]